jgi:hypothetical protein
VFIVPELDLLVVVNAALYKSARQTEVPLTILDTMC